MMEAMARHPQLLELERDSSPVADNQNIPFLLSLRNPEEFAKAHSFGPLKVPHIGVYGAEYTLCSTVVLLSLPATPSCIQKFPPDLISALGLEELPTHVEVKEPHHDSEYSDLMRRVAHQLVQLALQSALLRVEKAGAVRGGANECSMDILTNGDSKQEWAGLTPSLAPGGRCVEACNAMDTGSSETKQRRSKSHGVKFTDVVMEDSTTAQQKAEDDAVSMERRHVARRLVLKCIRAACHIIDSGDRRDSIEYLIASTKRIRISSPPPPPPPPSFEETVLLTERCVTPESLKRQQLRKKRGRSDSHEVNSLTDYNLIRRQFSSRAAEERVQFSTKPINEEEEDHTLSSLMDNLGRMTIDESCPSSDSDREMSLDREVEPQCHGGDLVSSGVTFAIGTTNNPSPLSTTHFTAPLFTAMATPTPLEVKEATPTPLDVRAAISTDAVPNMDVYVIIHSCPPHEVCHKFLCHNTDEINLVYHCWLFGDAPCDPSLTVSSQLEVGVFDPSGVQPVHLNLQDGGAPFHCIDNRTICIHSCCFSPDNAQLQLVQRQGASPLYNSDNNKFHTFFSAARHGERRVVALHMLPSTVFTENLLRESIVGCSTLKQLLLKLNPQFPQTAAKLWDLVSSL